MRNRLNRGIAAFGATALALGLTTVGSGLASAADNTGVNSSTKVITIGATVPLSGIASLGYSDVAKAANAVFKYVNAKGGVNGWKVNFIIKDDCYNISGLGCTSNKLTVDQTDDLVTNQNVFATVGSLGTATQEAVKNTLRTAGVPQLFVNSGAKAWNNPDNYPTLFGFQPSYLVEGKILANYIKTKFAGKSVGVIGQNDDFGDDGLQGLLDGGLTIPSANRLTYASTDIIFARSNFKTQLAKLQAAKVQVVVLDTVPQATQLILDAATQLKYKPQFVISGVGADPITVNRANEKGAISFSFLPASTDTKNPWNAWITKVLKADKTGFPSFKGKLTGNMQYGAAWGVAFLQVLKKTTDGGVTPTRTNFVAKMTQTTFNTPALVQLAYSNSNHQGLNGGYIVSVKSTTETSVADKQIYTTGTGPISGSPLVKASTKIAPIDTWLK